MQVIWKPDGYCGWFAVPGAYHPSWRRQCGEPDATPQLPPPPTPAAASPPPPAEEQAACRMWKVQLWHVELPALKAWVCCCCCLPLAQWPLLAVCGRCIAACFGYAEAACAGNRTWVAGDSKV